MLELYQIELCPFCAKVRRKLGELGIDYIIRNVPHHEEEKRAALVKLSGDAQVPTLVDKDLVMKESDDIIAYLEEEYGN